MANPEKKSLADLGIQVDEPALAVLEAAEAKTRAPRGEILKNVQVLQDETIDAVADAVDKVVGSDGSLEAVKELMDTLSEARSLANDTFDRGMKQDADHFEAFVADGIGKVLDLLGKKPTHEANVQILELLNRAADDYVDQVNDRIASPEEALSNIIEAVERSIDDISLGEDGEALDVPAELVEALGELVSQHQALVEAEQTLLQVARTSLNPPLEDELEKLQKLQELLAKLGTSTGSDRARRKEIREELSKSPEFKAKKKGAFDALGAHGERASQAAREENREAHLQIEAELDEAVELRLAELEDEKDPKEVNRSDVTRALLEVKKRVELLSRPIRDALSYAAALEGLDDEMPALEGGVDGDTDKELILKEALGMDFVEIRKALRRVLKGNGIELKNEDLAKALEDYHFTSRYLGNSGPGAKKGSGADGSANSEGEDDEEAPGSDAKASTAPAPATPAPKAPAATPAALAAPAAAPAAAAPGDAAKKS